MCSLTATILPSHPIHPPTYPRDVRLMVTAAESYKKGETTKCKRSELKSCVKVEVAVLGSPSPVNLMVTVDVQQH